MKKLSFFLSIFVSTSFAYTMQISSKLDLTKEKSNADEFVAKYHAIAKTPAQQRHIKQSILLSLQKPNMNLIDIADQLSIPYQLNQKQIEEYKAYLNNKAEMFEKITREKAKQSGLEENGIKKGFDSLYTIEVKNNYGHYFLDESNKKRAYYAKLGAKTENGLLSIEEEAMLKEKVKTNEMKHFLAIYHKNKAELQQQIDKLVQKGQIANYCVNKMIARDFAQGGNIYKNLYPEFKIGNFTLTQNKAAILTPSFAEIKKSKTEQGENITDKIRPNLFVINADKNLLQKMTHQVLPREVMGNLYQTNINDLALLSVKLEGDDKKHFFEVAKKLVEYNALVCLY